MRRRVPLTLAGAALVTLLGACGGSEGTGAPSAASDTESQGEISELSARLREISDAAHAQSVHVVNLQAEGMAALLYTGNEVQFWTYTDGEPRHMQVPLPPDTVLGAGVPAGSFPLDDVEPANEMAGSGCAQAVTSVTLTPSGKPMTVVDCPDPDQRLAAYFDGIPSAMPDDFYGIDYLAKQLDFAAAASPDGKVWNIGLAVDQEPAGRVTSVSSTGFMSANGKDCPVTAIAMPLQGRMLYRDLGEQCSTEDEMHEMGIAEPFDPAMLDPNAVADSIQKARDEVGDAFTLLAISVADGAPTLKAMNEEMKQIRVPLN